MTLVVHNHNKKTSYFGFKIYYQDGDNQLSTDVSYKFYQGNEFIAEKTLNKCNEFLKIDIKNWIVKNKLSNFKKGKPPKFHAKVLGNKIFIGEQIR